MRDAPWLSVIMPTYNGSAFIRHALDSILAQGIHDIEVVAVDDGSTDDTVPILKEYAARLPVTVIEPGHVGNWVAGTNRGLREATGRFASILHQDDAWLPGRLERVRSELAREPGREILLVHPVLFIDERGRRVGQWRCPLPAGRLLSPDYVVERLLVQDFLSLPGTVFPRAVALEVGMDEDLWYTADWDLWLHLASRLPTLYVARTLGAVRVHGTSITMTETSRLDEFREQHEIVLRRHLAAWAVTGKRRARVRRAAELSIEVNVALSAIANRKTARLGALLGQFLRAGPSAWAQYLRNSRIHERAVSRLRAGLGRRRTSRT